jgi:hypothetical protein
MTETTAALRVWGRAPAIQVATPAGLVFVEGLAPRSLLAKEFRLRADHPT